MAESLTLATKFTQIAADTINDGSEASWASLAKVAHSIANILRVREGPVDNHSELGNTSLSKDIALLCNILSKDGPTTMSLVQAHAIFELFRVCANLCMDHDENRGRLLKDGVLKCILDLLGAYASLAVPSPPSSPISLSIEHLKAIRTAIGVILNASIGFDPVQEFLFEKGAEVTLLKLSTAVYPPGAWILDDALASTQESWAIRVDISTWTWRVLSEIKDEENTNFSVDILPYIVWPLVSFTDPHPPTLDVATIGSKFINSLTQADFDCLEESCTMIEALALDMEDFRLALARTEHGGVSCLPILLDFIEKGDYHPLWTDADRQRRQKSFDMYKAAIVKSVVEVAGEPKSEDILWDNSDPSQPGGAFVSRMVKWIVDYVSASGKSDCRDDLAICATLALGNLSRRDHHASILLSPPHSLAPILTSNAMIGPSTDIRLKHGVLGFLKNIVQSSSSNSTVYNALSSSDVIPKICASGIWDETTDAMTNIVQLNGIGVVKHLCNNSVDSSLKMIQTAPKSLRPSGLHQILSLVRRADSVPLRSEGVRVLVNIVKSFFASAANPSIAVPVSLQSEERDDLQSKRETGINALLTPECAGALAGLLAQSTKYPILVNEALVALSLLCTQKSGASLALKAILPPDSADAADVPGSTTSSDASSPVVATPPPSLRDPPHPPASAFSVILSVLKNADTPYPVEIRINACSLLSQLSKNLPPDDIMYLKENASPVLQAVYDENRDAEGKEELLAKAAKRVLDTWLAS